MPRVAPPSLVSARTFVSISGERVALPDEARHVHLQFRRFAGCPVCDLHLRAFARRHHEIEAAGVREVVIFHSSAQALRPYTSELPFAVVADPDKHLYREFGVESAARALLSPRAWMPIARAVAASLWGIARHGRRMPPLRPEGGSLGLPADFLIAPDRRVVASHYGQHANDQWSVDDLLALAGARRERLAS